MARTTKTASHAGIRTRQSQTKKPTARAKFRSSGRKFADSSSHRANFTSFSPIPKLNRTLDARPDTADFRDRMYEATLVEVPPRIELETYMNKGVPILNQGKEGACTGFGLATV